MTKKVTRKNTRKSVSISHRCFGEKITVKTKKTCVGNPILTDKKCQTCINHPTSLVPLVCLCKAGMDKVQKTKKTRKAGKVGLASEVKNTIIEMAKEEVWDRKGLGRALRDMYPEYSKITLSTYISDSFNPKYYKKTGCGILLRKNSKNIIVIDN